MAETHKDLVEVMIEGASGLASVFPPEHRPTWTRKPVQVKFHTGAIALGYNGTEPDQLRGPQFDAAWLDELAKWRYARETWDMLQFGLRLGDGPQQIVTTTPRPIPLLREIMADNLTVITRGRMMDNAANLAERFLAQITAKYEGTRLGRQELDAEILDDLPGALWSRAWIDAARRPAPLLKRIVVGIDPAVTSQETSDDPGTHGLSVCGMGHDERGYVLEDASMQGTPLDWARRAVALYRHHGADMIVAEVNNGGDMVKSTIRSVDPLVPVKLVRATRGKHVRAEPVAALYEQGRVSHVATFAGLEDQLCQFTTAGYEGEGSPDRADAMVWALTELFPDMTLPPAAPDEARTRKASDYSGPDDDGEGDDWRVM